jgi:hypothetical protein
MLPFPMSSPHPSCIPSVPRPLSLSNLDCSPLFSRHSPLFSSLPSLLTRVFAVPRTISHFGPLCFQSFAHSSALMRGGGGMGSFDFRVSNFEFRSRSTLSSLFSNSSTLFCIHANLNPFLFKQFRTLSQKHPGAGIPLLPQWNATSAFPATPPKTPVE